MAFDSPGRRVSLMNREGNTESTAKIPMLLFRMSFSVEVVDL